MYVIELHPDVLLEPAFRRCNPGYVAGRPCVPERSNADFLVEFAADAQPDLHSFYGAKAKLKQLLGRGLDLVAPGAVRYPHVLASINRHREAVYAA